MLTQRKDNNVFSGRRRGRDVTGRAVGFLEKRYGTFVCHKIGELLQDVVVALNQDSCRYSLIRVLTWPIIFL